MKKFFIVLVVLFCSSAAFSADRVTVFAAASATDMLNEVIERYNAEGGNVVASYASSGVLAKQIESGAPASIFISANQEWMDYLQERKLIVDSTRKNYLGNILVLIAPSDSRLTYSFSDKKKFSTVIGNEKFAIGDPAHVPAGQYSEIALKKMDLWNDIEKNIVRADNVRVVLMYVSRSEVPMGIVFGSDAVASDGVKVLDTLPKETYGDISYPIALLKDNNNAEAKKFYDYLMSDDVKIIIKKYGFDAL